MTLARATFSSIAFSIMLATGLMGCGAGGPDTSCSPDISVTSPYGTVSIQQKGKDSSIQWGAYPSTPLVGTYTATVYRDGKRIDGPKKQPYPPHGSILAGRTKTGQTIRV